MDTTHTHQRSSAAGHEQGNPILSASSTQHPSSPQDELTLKDIVDLLGQARVIIRAKWYYGLAAALAVGIGLGSFVMRRPIESKVQTVLLAQGALDKILGQDSHSNNEMARENSLRNHLSVMESRKFRQRLLGAFSAAETEGIIKPYRKPNDVVDADWLDAFLDAHIAIERERGRELYTITVSHVQPEMAVLLANRFSSEYMSLVQAEFKSSTKEGYELLQKQAKLLSEEIATIEESKLEYRRKHKIISQTDNQGILTERLKRIDANLEDIRIKRLQLNTQYKQAKQDRESAEYPWNNAYLATFANNATLRQELDRAMAARAALAARYGTKHPKLRDAEANIQGIRDNILRNFDIAVGDLQTQLEQAVETETQLQREFDESFDRSVEIEKLASRLQVMNSEEDGKRETLTQLQKKIGEAAISSELPADIMQVVDPGFLVKPRIPKRLLLIALVILVSLCAFVCTPLLADLMDERVKGTSDLEASLGLPLLGAIPRLRGTDDERAHIVRNQVDLVTTESFVGISGGLDISAGRMNNRVILLTSTLPSEGKSLIASNLASTYRQLKRSVVILDLDLRRPSQHTLHAVKNSSGFLTWMGSGGEPHIEALPDGVALLPAGGHDNQPTHHYVSPKMASLIEDLRRRFDIVIVDTPPAGVFQDAMVLARHADERILVVREAEAPTVQVRKVIEDFGRAKSPFTGMILNGFNPQAASKKLAYGYKAGSKGYAYAAAG